MLSCWVVLLAAGSGNRLRQAGIGTPKQFILFHGIPLFWHSARAFAVVPAVQGIVFVFPQHEDTAVYYEQAVALDRRDSLGVPWKVVAGGDARQDSVRLGLAAVPAICRTVLVHDAARPFVSGAVISRVLAGLEDGRADGVIPAVPITDTIKSVGPDAFVLATHERDALRAVQTPQGFKTEVLRKVHAEALKKQWTVTDDAALLEQGGYPVRVVAGDPENKKITYKEDLALLDDHRERADAFPCTGFGYDVHRYNGDRPVVLGGVPIACNVCIAAHSDGDTVLHALIDAVLGCLGKGDIGVLFPDDDPRYENISSGVLLAQVLRLAAQDGLVMHHVDITIVAQTPRIAPHREAIARNVAKLLYLPDYAVNVKATTEEKLGFTGEKRGMKVMAVVTGSRRYPG